VFATTTTIGLRVVPVGKVAIERAQAAVDVLGGSIGVKVGVAGGRVVNVSVEFEDVAALAAALGIPVKEALRAATAAAETAYPVTAASSTRPGAAPLPPAKRPPPAS
jgi:pyridinium-3,5-bisthiocarboxylic acid mononucleotide nickel chelatase